VVDSYQGETKTSAHVSISPAEEGWTVATNNETLVAALTSVLVTLGRTCDREATFAVAILASYTPENRCSSQGQGCEHKLRARRKHWFSRQLHGYPKELPPYAKIVPLKFNPVQLSCHEPLPRQHSASTSCGAPAAGPLTRIVFNIRHRAGLKVRFLCLVLCMCSDWRARVRCECREIDHASRGSFKPGLPRPTAKFIEMHSDPSAQYLRWNSLQWL
jgi:hypothetical protein